MPTVKPRYTFTDTGKVSRMLDEGQKYLPEVEDRKDLLLELAELGAEQLRRDYGKRREAIERSAGMLTGVYPENALAELREDWPE